MTKRSIADEEVALIKAMLGRGMRSRDIQFFFNRPDRAVNTGRITGIADQTYSDTRGIAPAADAVLDAFLEERDPASRPLDASLPRRPTMPPFAVLRGMFSRTTRRSVWQLSNGETDTAECKATFGLRHMGKWLRAVAALANNRGGCIFFGVADKDETGAHLVTGIDIEAFLGVDAATISEHLRATFEPTPRVERTTIKVGDKVVGILWVEQHPSRPVIARKQRDEINEGDIFYRYPGQSRRISHADLRAMLDARDAQARNAMVPMVRRLLDLGPDRAMLADLEEGRLTDGKRDVQLDPETVERLKFIKEGEFDEVAGAPALRLIGDVRMATAAPTAIRKGVVTPADVQNDFLTKTLTADPMDYVRCALEIAGTTWLPIRFFARHAGKSDTELLEVLEANRKAPRATRTAYRERLTSIDAAFTPPNAKARTVLQSLLSGSTGTIADVSAAQTMAQAIQALPRPLSVDAQAVRDLIHRCVEISDGTHKDALRTAIRRAIARLDELENG